MDELVLADIQTLATSPDYGGRGLIQPSTAVLGLSAALFLSDLSIWQGAGYELTDAEIDDIQAMIAQLEEDLMLTGDMYAMDKCKVTMAAAQVIPDGVVTALLWDVEVYDPEGMHSTTSNTQKINVLRDGLHLVDVQVEWAASAVGNRSVTVSKYDFGLGAWVSIGRHFIQTPNASSPVVENFSLQDDAVEGDAYRVLVAQYSGGDLDASQGTTSPYFSVARL